MDTRKYLKELNARQEREAMRNGVVLRAQTFKNKKKVQNKLACRNKGAWA